MTGVDVTSSVDAPCSPAELFAIVEDLSVYPTWLSIVPKAMVAEGDAADPGPAWAVDLRGRLGPLARSKRLRMVRTEHESPTHVRFERGELDGREHSPWVLDAEVEATEHGSRLTMRLHYGGSLGGSILEHMLRDEIEESRPRLIALVSDASTP